MPDPEFDQEFVRFMLKFADDANLGSGLHMDAAGWIAWIKHIAEMDGRQVSNTEALHRLERILDDRPNNPFRPAVRARWEDRIIDLVHDRVQGPAFSQKVDEAITHFHDLFKVNGVTLTSAEWNIIEKQFRIRVLEMVAVQMALGGGQYHVRDAAARAFRKMWAANEWELQERLPVPVRAWMPVFRLEEV
jgi:hypothetical protein